MGDDTPSMFDGLEGVGGREKPQRERSLAYGACPMCLAEKVGLVRSPDGAHLVWRMHNLTTFVGTKLPCSSTGQHLCQAPARHLIGHPIPRCSHERTQP